jgi:phosphoribosyl-dephospho-CoA transferase
MANIRPWSRHELLRVASPAWSRILASRPDLAAVPYLADWIDNGWPVIVRRRVCDDRADLVPIGVPLPPSAVKKRIGLTIPPEAVLERSRPPSLGTVRHAAGASWERAINELIVLGARHAATPCVIGSLFWQYQTGLRYLSPQSDLDLLWYAHPGYGIRSLLSGLEAIERIEDIRIDGEVVFADGGAVNWRELHLALDQGGAAEVLVKSMDGVSFTKLAHLPSLWSAA